MHHGSLDGSDLALRRLMKQFNSAMNHHAPPEGSDPALRTLEEWFESTVRHQNADVAQW